MRTLIRAVALVAVAGIAGSAPSTAHAACTTIPPVGRVYQSEVGSVQARLAAPGAKIHLIHQRCDGDDTYFDAVRTNNEVRVTFTPDPNDPSLDTVIGPFAPGEVRCDANGICNHLVFTMPSTVDSKYPYGLAGVAHVEVRLKNASPGKEIAARIGELFEPSNTCVRQTPDPVFGHFTVLPPANDVQAVTGTSEIRATLDGHGNVLVPLDHTAARGGSTTLAAFEHGFADFCSVKPGLFGCKPFEVRPRIHHKIADGAHDRALLTSFSLDGHRIAPIIDHDDTGGIFGLADGDGSVVRIARRRQNADRFDLGYLRKPDAKGPLLFSHKTTSGSMVCHRGKMQGARANRSLVAHVDHGDMLMVHAVSTASGQCGTSTLIMPDETTLPIGRRERIVGADEGVVATVSGATLRAFDKDGVEHSSGPIFAATGAVVNDYALAPWKGDVYFRTLSGDLERWTGGASTVLAVAGTTRAEIHETHVLALGSAIPAPATAFDAGSSVRTPLNASGTDIANGRDAAAIALTSTTSGPSTLTAWPWSGNTIGPRDDTTAVVDPNPVGGMQLGVTDGCGRGTCTTRFVVVSSEADQQQKLNADSDLTDHVIRLYRPSTKTWDEPRLAATEFVTSDQFVAFRVPEGEEGVDLNEDKDQDDHVLYVAAFDGLFASPFRWISTGFAATGWSGRWHELGWRTPYLVVDRSVHFLVEEAQQRMDLDGDGKLVSTLLAIFDVPAQRISFEIPHTFPNQFIFDKADGELRLVGNGLAIGDLDRDGVLDPLDSCATKANPRQIDDDYDGLGDRVCDASYCDDTVPPRSTPGAPIPLVSARVVAATEAYLTTRARVEAECFKGLAAQGARGGDPNPLCRGSFLGAGSNPGTLWSESQRERVASAEAGVLRALGVSTERSPTRRQLAQHHYGRRVVRALGEAVDATTRVTLGRVRRAPARAEAQGRLVEIVTAYLTKLMVAMQRCALTVERRADLSARCLGRIEGGRVVLPAALRELGQGLERLDAGQLQGTKGCAASGDGSCLRCTTWRNAVRATLTLLGATDPPSYDLAQGTQMRASR